MNGPAVLVVSGCPPGDGCVGEVILRDLVRHYAPGTFAFMVLSETPSPTALRDGAAAITYRPDLSLRPPARRLPGRAGALAAWAATSGAVRRLRRRAAEAVKAAAGPGTRAVWTILDAAGPVAVGDAVAAVAGVPVVSLVWDCPSYFLQRAGFDAWSRRLLMRHFGACLGQSCRVGVVSEAMRRTYADAYGARGLITRHGLAAAAHAAVRTLSPGPGPVTIGYAGGLYATGAWLALLQALDSLGWRLNGREIKLTACGSDFVVRTRGPATVELLGWRSDAEVFERLSACDILYLPQPFDDYLRTLARLSFPTKLSTYAATGRPVVLHAPAHASLVSYFGTHAGTAVCRECSPHALVPVLRRLVDDAGAYAAASRASVAMARQDLNEESFRRQFAELLGVQDRLAAPA